MKVGLGLTFALLGLAGSAVVAVTGKRTEATAAEHVVTISTVSVKLGNLLHETQREPPALALSAGASGHATLR